MGLQHITVPDTQLHNFALKFDSDTNILGNIDIFVTICNPNGLFGLKLMEVQFQHPTVRFQVRKNYSLVLPV